MPAVYFEKISEHNTVIGQENTIIWLVETIERGSVQGGKEYYVKASKVHKTLDGRLWTDSRNLIHPDKVFRSDRIPQGGKETPRVQQEPVLHQQITCGHCNRVNLVNIDRPVQGSHQCVSCRSTICIIAGNHLQLKNGSKAGNTQLVNPTRR